MIFKYLGETLHTLNVTAYQPIGWGLGKVQDRVRNRIIQSPEAARLEQNCPVILVHGIFHNASAFYRLERKCRRHGFTNVNTIELWTSLQSLESMALQLHQEVERRYLKHKNSYKQGKVRIVAHSLGGMVTRTALRNEHFASMVDKIIFLGTPHQGSPLYEFPFPPCLKDLSSSSALMKSLKTDPLPGGIEYWNLRGRLDVVVPGKRTLLPGVPNLIFDEIGHAGLLSNPKVANCIVTLLEDLSIKKQGV